VVPGPWDLIDEADLICAGKPRQSGPLSAETHGHLLQAMASARVYSIIV
jgi:hypothetical protein